MNFLEMSKEEYDKYMCETYPELFIKRHAPKTETCMCWGFKIGKGWYELLNDTCKKVDIIREETGAEVFFQQIKSKFAGARFYHDYTPSDKVNVLWYTIINDIVASACNESCYICEDCGVHRSSAINLGNWLHALCPDCFRGMGEARGTSKEIIEGAIVRSAKIERVKNYSNACSHETLDAIIDLIEGYKDPKPKIDIDWYSDID